MGNILGGEAVEDPLEDPSPLGRDQLEQMTCRVQEVLPHVPRNAIYRDLQVTASIDETITRFIEGIVTYQPVVPANDNKPSTPQSSLSSTSVSSTSCGQTSLITAADTFASTPEQRHQSFEERKKLLIDVCRRRYLEKHGMLPVVSSDVASAST